MLFFQHQTLQDVLVVLDTTVILHACMYTCNILHACMYIRVCLHSSNAVKQTQVSTAEACILICLWVTGAYVTYLACDSPEPSSWRKSP